MKTIFVALTFSLCFNFCYGAVFDPYSRRYNIRKTSYSTLFTKTNGDNMIAKAIKDSGIPECQATLPNLFNSLTPNFVSASSMSDIHANLEKCPTFYDTFRHKNISTWGPFYEFLHIYNMQVLEKMWTDIGTIESNGKCKMFNNMIKWLTINNKVTIRDFLNSNYESGLCMNTDQTMYKWHQLLGNSIFNGIDGDTKYFSTSYAGLEPISIGLTKIMAKMYLTQARYDSYFIASPEYGIVTYFNATLTSTSWSITEKGHIKALINYYKQQFPSITLEERKNKFQMKFSESIDTSYIYFNTLNRILLNPSDGINHYDLLLYIVKGDYLNEMRLKYFIATTTTNPTTTTEAMTTTEVEPTTTPPAIITTTTDAASTTAPEVPSTSTTTMDLPSTTTTDAPIMQTTDILSTTAAEIPQTSTTTMDIPLTSTTAADVPESTTMEIPSTPIALTTTEAPLTTTELLITTTEAPLTTTIAPSTTTMEDPLTTTTPMITTTTTMEPTTTACPYSMGNVEIFIGNGVSLTSTNFEKIPPIGTCETTSNGEFTYFDGATNPRWDWASSAAGDLDRTQCAEPCVCSDTTCYKPEFDSNAGGDPNSDPRLTLYPHCEGADCYMAIVLYTPGFLVNPNDSADFFHSDGQYTGDFDIRPVSDAAYLKATKIGCSGCPVPT